MPETPASPVQWYRICQYSITFLAACWQSPCGKAGCFPFFSGRDVYGMGGEKETLKAYHTWVFAAVNAIADRFADVGPYCLRKNQTISGKQCRIIRCLISLASSTIFGQPIQLFFAHAASEELDGNDFWSCQERRGSNLLRYGRSIRCRFQ